MPDRQRRPIALLVNPVAGGKPASGPPLGDPDELTPEALRDRFARAGLEVHLHALAEEDDAAALAVAAAEGGADVVVGGGDGTVGAVAGALTRRSATLGILAMGSFNNIARGIGLPDTIDDAVEVIVRGSVAEIDAGAATRGQDAGERLFFEGAGVGLDAVYFGAAQVTTRRGLWRGLRAAWRALRWKRRRMVVELDGHPSVTSALVVTVSNGAYYGFGFTVAADADPTDGAFEVSIFTKMSSLELIRHFLAVSRGRRLYEPRIVRQRASRVSIRGLRRSLPAHADGQLIGPTPVEFVVLPGALRVFR